MQEVAETAPADVVLVLAEMVKENPPLSNAFIAEFASRMQGQGSALIFPITWLEHRVAEQGQTIEIVFQQASQSQAADQVSIGNSIGSLRFLGADGVARLRRNDERRRAGPPRRSERGLPINGFCDARLLPPRRRADRQA